MSMCQVSPLGYRSTGFKKGHGYDDDNDDDEDDDE